MESGTAEQQKAAAAARDHAAAVAKDARSILEADREQNNFNADMKKGADASKQASTAYDAMAQAVSKAAQSFGVGKQAADQFGQSVANAAKSVVRPRPMSSARSADGAAVGKVFRGMAADAKTNMDAMSAWAKTGFSGIGDIARDTMDGMATNVERGSKKWERRHGGVGKIASEIASGMGKAVSNFGAAMDKMCTTKPMLGQDGFGHQAGLNKMNGSMQSGMNKFSVLPARARIRPQMALSRHGQGRQLRSVGHEQDLQQRSVGIGSLNDLGNAGTSMGNKVKQGADKAGQSAAQGLGQAAQAAQSAKSGFQGAGDAASNAGNHFESLGRQRRRPDWTPTSSRTS